MTTFDLWIWQDGAPAASHGWYGEVTARTLTPCDICRWNRGIDRFRS